MQGVKKYKEFWGKSPMDIFKGVFHRAKTLIYLGDVTEIVYRSNKKNGGGDGTMCEYKHKFKKGAHLYMDEKGRTQLYIIGKQIKVREAGIIN